MNEVRTFIESGILEMYVMGQTTAEENATVEHMASIYDEVHTEINDISITLEQYAKTQAKVPDPTIQPVLIATLDYMNRMKNGEKPSYPPSLHAGSKISDYTQWLNRTDLEPEEAVTDIYASIIGNTPELMTAIVWIKNGAPSETHSDQLEKFLIVEGSCDITIENEVRHLSPGDMLTIPLHKSHYVQVTSDCLCKIILQRAAA